VLSIGQKNELQFFDAGSDVSDVGFDCVHNLVDMAGEDQFSHGQRANQDIPPVLPFAPLLQPAARRENI
jgi:hypothetical protein